MLLAQTSIAVAIALELGYEGVVCTDILSPVWLGTPKGADLLSYEPCLGRPQHSGDSAISAKVVGVC